MTRSFFKKGRYACSFLIARLGNNFYDLETMVADEDTDLNLSTSPAGIQIIFRRHPYWFRFGEGSGFEPGDYGTQTPQYRNLQNQHSE